MKDNLAWTYMVDFLNREPTDAAMLARLCASSIGDIVECRTIGRK